ncbi:CRISPR-associated endonuclease Cas2 [Rhodothermus marinus]|uniref:CRISPR-associated endonuclease Cas2 n=1 Tax=Rhodothermus marinus TaxID=29549 RepID=UPI0012BA3A5B|nr:CRISPR-associated endonuclease Cas2 [Rhodothermus marinus]BBM69628.1 CRISPR-associated endoribonuclease Cas2 [Rhodothermus marinus]BBM72610.1 CRISPR-associated endoribonuclease Cas2 [Rhodothermus marinus]
MAFWLIGYDIADPRRLQRVARLLEDYGQRLQYSVFLCRLEAEAIRQLRRGLLRIVDLEEDRLFFLRLCQGCIEALEQIGQGKGVDLRQNHWIV